MKLRFRDKLPAAQLRLPLAGEVMQRLQLYQRYLNDDRHQERELKEIAITILEGFLFGRADREFEEWRKRNADVKAEQEGGSVQDGAGVRNTSIKAVGQGAPHA
jgi:hypothetical protein